MEEFDQYWILLPDKDNTFYSELIGNINESKNDEDASSETGQGPFVSLRLSTVTFLENSMRTVPYPTCQMLRALPSISSEIAYKTLVHLVSHMNHEDEINKLLNILVNGQINQKHLGKLKHHLFPLLLSHIKNSDFNKARILYCLLADENYTDSLLGVFYKFYKDQESENLTKTAIFICTIEKQVHFMQRFLMKKYSADCLPGHLSDSAFVATAIANICRPKFNRKAIVRLNVIDLDQFTVAGSAIKLFTIELRRLLHLQQALSYHIPNMRIDDDELVSHSGIVRYLMTKIDLATFDYGIMRDILIQNQQLNFDIRLLCPVRWSIENTLPVHLNELEIYDQYSVLKVFIDIFLLSYQVENYKEIIDIKMMEAKNILRNIESIVPYVEVLELTFSLLFLRWEHLADRSISTGDLDETIESYTEDNAVDPINKLSSKKPEKIGFVCGQDTVERVLNLLKKSATQRKHYETFSEADDSVKKKFFDIFDSINNAIWRLSLFKSTTEYTLSQSITSVDFSRMLQFHALDTDKQESSSDEDGNTVNKSSKSRKKSAPNVIIRRKPRRKHQPFRKSDGDKSGISFSQSTENDQKFSGIGADTITRNYLNNDRRCCVVSKMLGSGEHLVTSCLRKGDLEAARNILKTYNLESSNLGHELNFFENLNHTKQKLKDIFRKYQKEEIVQSTLDTTVERIKKIAAVGFEASKITNIMATFATSNEIPQNTESHEILQRFLAKYYFLQNYQLDCLPATIVVDLALSLSKNYDISSNIFNMLIKTWPACSSEIATTANEQCGTGNVGFVGFFRQLVECLRIYKNVSQENIGIKKLMSYECYSMNTKELKEKLETENTFRSLMKINVSEIDTLDQLGSYSKKFDEFKSTNVNYIKRLCLFADNAIRLMQYKRQSIQKNPTDIFQLNVISLIGELIFEHSISPLEIEGFVSNLNINLVYALAINAVPVISPPQINESDSLYILNLLENILEPNSDEDLNEIDENIVHYKFYKIDNPKVINYIKRHNHLLMLLIAKIQGLPDDLVSYSSDILDNMCSLEEIQTLSALYEDNVMLSAVNYDELDLKRLKYFLLKKKDYRKTWSILHQSKEHVTRVNAAKVHLFKDSFIVKILDDGTINNETERIEKIYCINVQAFCLLKHILTIDSSNFAKRLIKNILFSKRSMELDQNYRDQLEKWLHDIDIYAQIATTIPHANWSIVMAISEIQPEVILQQLIDQKMFSLCVEWSKIHRISDHFERINQFIDIFSNLISNVGDREIHPDLFKLIETLPKLEIIRFYSGSLDSIQNFDMFKYFVEYLVKNSDQTSTGFQKYQMSVKIFEQLSFVEQDSLWNLVSTPLLIIEQYLMNTKFEILSVILDAIRPLLSDTRCKVCCPLLNSIFDKPNSFSNRKYDNPEFLTNYHHNQSITQDCIDALLRMYATKALDFRVTGSHSSTDVLSQSTDMSFDSLCGTFVMPKEALPRNKWVRDEDATLCMCCRRSVFTMLTRRHHCRQCGRVVCHACSTKRMEVPSLYADLPVRVCQDCYSQMEQLKSKIVHNQEGDLSLSQQQISSPSRRRRSSDDLPEWRFSANPKHDALLREEFCYEYAPSVSLCLTILTYHSSTVDCANFLLFHCQKFEALLRPIQPGCPNQEIDYALVTRMLNCLALAAKVRGGPPECDIVRDHAEIIRSVVKNGCESFLPMQPPNSSSFRELRDSLVIEEKWSLALEVSLKCGFSTTGVMAAWGIACLKAGCFETAREKFIHCMRRTVNDAEQFKILNLVSSDSSVDLSTINEFPQINRVQKSSPLLSEIINILEISCRPTYSDVLARASIIKDSNTSLSSKKSRKKDNIPLHEPALNILQSLSNLKKITQGIYVDMKDTNTPMSSKSAPSSRLTPNSRIYDESLYYLINFGSHLNIIQFLIKHNQLFTALKYFLFQNVDPDVFVQAIFLPYLRQGKTDTVITIMLVLDETLMLWKKYLIQTCRHLERKGLLNSLYHLQILLNDPVRASMTCVRFYSANCVTFKDLQNNSFHLLNAQKHLQTELELCQWEEIKVNAKKVKKDETSLLMKMDSKTLNSHINTILRQIEVTKFLAKCEQEGRETISLLPKITLSSQQLPTLFGTIQEKIQLVILTLICGTNIEEGFGLAFRIIQDFNLNTTKAFGGTAKFLAENNRLQAVEKLIDCIKSNNGRDSSFCDEIISLSIQTAVASSSAANAEMKDHFANLIRLVSDIGMKINCHILGGQLKAAYLLAVQHNRINDVKRVWRQADQLNQSHIKKLCEKKLNISQG